MQAMKLSSLIISRTSSAALQVATIFAAASSPTTLSIAASAAMSTSATPATTCTNVGANGNSYQSKISTLAASIQPRELVQARGSGNFGESGKAAFYTIDTPPQGLVLPNQDNIEELPPLERHDIDLGPNRKAFWIDNVLTHDQCDALAACAESILEHNGHSRLAPGIQTPPGMRVNEAAHWYPSQKLANDFLDQHVLSRIRSLVPQEIDSDNGKMLPLYPRISEKIAQFKYNQGDEFNRHIDGLFPGQGINADGTGVDEWTGVVSGFSMLFYLNDLQTDGLKGGQTRLWSADGTKQVDVEPKRGRVLFFRRGSRDAVLHAGLPVTGSVPKYMALINLAYGTQIGTRPLIM